MLVIKADGTHETFNPAKLRNSLRRAGASKTEIEEIVSEIMRTLQDGVRTQVIYRKAFDMLRRSERPVAAKYSLRRALFNLGPTGFPFEDFLARLFEEEGYRTVVGTNIKGACATHEIDIAAYSKTNSFVAEAKFHSGPGINSDMQVVLYSYARFLDLRSRAICKADHCGIRELYVVTNTKFTTAAIDYARCVGIKLLGWDYPRGASLQQRIEEAGLYPITVLTTLPGAAKRQLIDAGVVVCKDIVRDPRVLARTGLKGKRADAVVMEALSLCKAKK